MISKLLKELGLTDYESKIYLSLLNLGTSVAGRIAEKAKLNRRNVYDSLQRLVKKGFLTYCIKNNKKYYTPVNPKKIVELYEEKLDLAKDLMPEITSLYNKKNTEREVHVFEGTNSLKTLAGHMLDEKQTLHIIGSTGKSMEIMPIFINQVSLKSKKVKIKDLWNYDATHYKKITTLFNSENRILPKNFKTSTQIFVSGDKTIILVWTLNPLAILIIDKETSKGFKSYFDFLWSVSKEMYF